MSKRKMKIAIGNEASASPMLFPAVDSLTSDLQKG
jgi:hypothetical protein